MNMGSKHIPELWFSLYFRFHVAICGSEEPINIMTWYYLWTWSLFVKRKMSWNIHKHGLSVWVSSGNNQDTVSQHLFPAWRPFWTFFIVSVSTLFTFAYNLSIRWLKCDCPCIWTSGHRRRQTTTVFKDEVVFHSGHVWKRWVIFYSMLTFKSTTDGAELASEWRGPLQIV